MQVSAEIRWFWRGAAPPGLADWFQNAGTGYPAAGGSGPREDEYVRDSSQPELGIKRRGGKKGVEVKGLVAVTWGGLQVGPFLGPIELWTKWTSEALDLGANPTVRTTKRRWLRKFDTSGAAPQEIELGADEKPRKEGPLPVLGCNVELTEVTLEGRGAWWTLGFEAFGTVRTVEHDLRAVAAALAERRPPDLGQGVVCSYPAWLQEHAPRSEAGE